MRVQKIIQANPEIFKTDRHKNYTEIEAILKIASVEGKGSQVQKTDFELRQTHLAICNLMNLGFRTAAVKLAVELITKAELAQRFRIAQDLCEILITHFAQIGDRKSVHTYKVLYDKFTSNISYEHQSMMLYGESIQNYNKEIPADIKEIKILIYSIEQKLPFDSLWYHYYYYQYSSLILYDEDLEQLFIEAITYFQNLHFKHSFFINFFTEGLIKFYVRNGQLNKADPYLRSLEPGSLPWYNSYLLYVDVLLEQNDIRSNDICILTMNHENFVELPAELKEKWKIVYKASVRLLLDNH